MKIRTLSHINEEHAAGPHFPEAVSECGRFFWHHGRPGYVGISCALTGLSDNTTGKVGLHQVYLQTGSSDGELTSELLADAHEFSAAVAQLKEARLRDNEPIIAPYPELKHADAWQVWRGEQSMDDEDSIF